MSVLVSTCHEINRACTNNSKSKQLWSLNKSKRFENSSNLTSEVSFFDKNYQLSKYRGASIGYGVRNPDYLKITSNTNDNIYDFKTDFDRKKLSFSMGKKHKNINKLYDENVKFNFDPLQPGPGFYNYDNLNKGKSYSFLSRNFNYAKKNKFPGSGSYEAEFMRDQGKYLLSKNKNIPNYSFGLGKDKRFKEVIKCKIN